MLAGPEHWLLAAGLEMQHMGALQHEGGFCVRVADVGRGQAARTRGKVQLALGAVALVEFFEVQGVHLLLIRRCLR